MSCVFRAVGFMVGFFSHCAWTPEALSSLGIRPGSSPVAPIGRGVFRMTLQRRVRSSDDEDPVSFLQMASATSTAGGAASSSVVVHVGGPPDGPPPVDVYGQICVGSVGSPCQEFSVAIDTGSSNLLLVSSRCRSIGCLAHRAYTASSSDVMFADDITASTSDVINLRLSTGRGEGHSASDRVCLGKMGSDVCAESKLVQITKIDQYPFNMFPYDGVLGVGMPGGSLDTDFDFMGKLVQANVLQENMFAVWLKTDDDKDQSEVLFGNYDDNRAASDILWYPASNASSGAMWTTTMADFTVDKVNMGLCGSRTVGCTAAFDTGTSVIAGPPEIMSALRTALDVKLDCSNYKTLKMFGFVFGSHIFSLDPQDYVKRAGSQCYHQIMDINLEGRDGMILLGDPFMKRYYTIFDRSELKIGLAFSAHAQRRGTEETSAEMSARMLTVVQT